MLSRTLFSEQKEYPPALRGALQRNGSRNTHRYGESISNLCEGIAGRSNAELRTPKGTTQVVKFRHSKFLVRHSIFGFANWDFDEDKVARSDSREMSHLNVLIFENGRDL